MHCPLYTVMWGPSCSTGNVDFCFAKITPSSFPPLMDVSYVWMYVHSIGMLFACCYSLQLDLFPVNLVIKKYFKHTKDLELFQFFIV